MRTCEREFKFEKKNECFPAAVTVLSTDVKYGYEGCVRVMLKNHKKSLFARSGLKKMAENHHFSVRVFIK